MEDFEFLKYETTPNDKYGMLGIATVRERRYNKNGEAKSPAIHRFKKIKTKDQSGEFFVGSSFANEKHGQKKYEDCFELDSGYDKTALMEWIHDEAKKFEAKSSVFSRESASGSVATQAKIPA